MRHARRTRAIVVAIAVGGYVGCIRPGPPGVDSTDPSIVLTALRAVGNPRFASDEPERQPKGSCVKFRSFPARLVLSVGDAGGVARASVRVLGARIPPESVSVGPDAPESSSEVTRPDGVSDVLTIQLSPPGPGTVRTGLVALFEVVPDDSPPIGLLVTATDRAGNSTTLYQVDLRSASDAEECL